MKTQHQNPEFGHKRGEIFFLTCKTSTVAFKQGGWGETEKTIYFGGKLCFI
jgi:hypothetical protein